AHRDAETGRGETRGQPIDRHDPPDVEHFALGPDRLEVRVVERQLPAEVLELAGHDDVRARKQPALDVATAEPCRLDRAGLVLELGDGPLDPAPERRLNTDIGDPDPG